MVFSERGRQHKAQGGARAEPWEHWRFESKPAKAGDKGHPANRCRFVGLSDSIQRFPGVAGLHPRLYAAARIRGLIRYKDLGNDKPLKACHYPKLSRLAIPALRPERAVDISRWWNHR